jgi:hypothetical protein
MESHCRRSLTPHAPVFLSYIAAGMTNLMFEGQAETALKQAKLLLKDRVFRIDVETKSGEFSLDDASTDKIKADELGRGEAVKKANRTALLTKLISA